MYAYQYPTNTFQDYNYHANALKQKQNIHMAQQVHYEKEQQKGRYKKVWKRTESQKNKAESLIVQTALKAQNGSTPWILDSGCSNHMSGDNDRFMNLEQYDGGSVKFGNNDGAKIVGKGAVQLNHGKITSKEVLFVNGLKHSLLSVSQICDQGHEVVFKKMGFEIRKSRNDKVVAVGSRTSGNLYTLSEIVKETCAIGQVEQPENSRQELPVYVDDNDDSEPVAQSDDREEGEYEDHSYKKRENNR
ncbi:hypothetical protein MRB53_006255 [Persea americana]|uniref:Uncharacterized protein n=1 Tax=Persea americana TaxID=3435 RepID=A0ACC2MH68_PERAE|nr:hypothetical protein MRB53_006255 [Persea americana]